MKYSNEVKSLAQATEGLVNSIDYPTTGSHAGKMMDSGVMSDKDAGLIVSTPAKKNAGPGWDSAMWSNEYVNFKGRP